MTQADAISTTRRAMLAAAGALPTVSAATMAAAAADPDAHFLEWQRGAKFWWAESNSVREKTDDEVNSLWDKATHFEELIATTAATGLTGARVKAAFLLGHCAFYADVENYASDRFMMAAIRSLIETLDRLR